MYLHIKKTLSYLIFVLGILYTFSSFSASAAENQMGVSATVVSTCSANIDNLDFGKYYKQEVYKQIRVYLQCTPGINFTITLDDSDAEYKMNRGSDHLFYKIYQDPTYKNPIGAGNIITGVTTGFNQDVILYAKIIRNQTVPKGFYHGYITVLFSTISDGTTQNPEYQVYLNIPVSVEKL